MVPVTSSPQLRDSGQIEVRKYLLGRPKGVQRTGRLHLGTMTIILSNMSKKHSVELDFGMAGFFPTTKILDRPIVSVSVNLESS